jgi:hypothetical protein
MKLTELSPRYSPPSISFQCPKCRIGIVSVWLQEGAPAEPYHGCNGLPPNFETLTITPSIADEGKCTASNRGCTGWHGFITNGEVQ